MIVEQYTEQLMRAIEHAAELYYRLVLVVGPIGSGKTALLQSLAQVGSYPYINLNLELSRRLLEVADRLRPLRVARLLDAIVQEAASSVVLVDQIELLFDTTLQQDPLQCLQQLSRSRTVVAAWSGEIESGSLTYARPGHPEYRRYPSNDLMITYIRSEQ